MREVSTTPTTSPTAVATFKRTATAADPRRGTAQQEMELRRYERTWGHAEKK